LDEAAVRHTSPSRAASVVWLGPPLSSIADIDRRGLADLAEFDRVELPLKAGTLLTIVKLLVDVPLLGATYDRVPPLPLSAEPGVSLIAAGAAKDMCVSLLLGCGC